MKQLIHNIQQATNDHAGIPFWSWNDRLEENELRRQIRNMKELGMQGFFMHARGGLETEYMSKEWFDAVRICIEEAQRLDMQAWAYDENGWPSGFAGGELLKDPRNHACGLVCQQTEIYPQPEESILGVYVVTPSGARRVDAPCGAPIYTVICRRRDFSYVDTMNRAVTEQFIAATHERYKQEIAPEHFGSVMPGFFTDEPQYFRYGTPWSDTFVEEFPKRFGYDVRDALPSLFSEFEGAKEKRYDYRLFCHEKFYSDFMQPIYEWCDRNGVQLTGHGIEEWGLDWQMTCCGGIMPFYLYQHLPGIDYLGRGLRNLLGAKQLGSVCAQTGKTRALSEMFACCGWDVTPKELKRIAELQFVGGVNLICEHLYPYSERGQRKNDYPNHYSEHNPWQKHFGQFEAYFAHLGAALAQGREVADTLVLHPIRSAYLDYFDGVPESVKELDDALNELVDALAFFHIPYHFGDETILRKMATVEGASIRVGACVYDKIVIPHCHTLDADTVALLKEYLAAGGKLCVYGKPPERVDGRPADMSFLIPNLTFEQLKAESVITIGAPLYAQLRATDDGHLLFVTNVTDQRYDHTEIRLQSCRGLAGLNLHTLETFPVRGTAHADGSVSVFIDFGDSESVLLIESDLPMLAPVPSKPKASLKLPQAWRLTALPENTLTLDRAKLSLDHGPFSEERPLVRIKNNLYTERFEGAVTLEFSLEVQQAPREALLVCEPLPDLQAAVNGIPVSFGKEHRFDRRFRCAPIAQMLKTGVNTIRLSFYYRQRQEVYDVLFGGGNEALRNCLSFDTEMEPIYIYGDFGVCSLSPCRDTDGGKYLRTDGPFALCKRKEQIDLGDINRNGYLFFAGELSAETTLEWHPGQPTTLRLGGRFATVGIQINQTDLGTFLFENEWDLGAYLTEGENTLRLTLCFSNRNLLGPHHQKESEPIRVSPRFFSFEKMWDGEACEIFAPDYAFVKFGI